MQIEDLIKAGKDQVRGDSNLMSAYIKLFTEKFGRKPDCAGCTFNNDWNRLTNSHSFENLEIMSDTTFKLRDNSIIYSYDYEDKKTKRFLRKRSFGNIMTEDFAESYLTHGTPEQIKERKKQFKILPEKFREVETSGYPEKLADMKALAESSGYPSAEFSAIKSKEKMAAYLDAKAIETSTETSDSEENENDVEDKEDETSTENLETENSED